MKSNITARLNIVLIMRWDGERGKSQEKPGIPRPPRVFPLPLLLYLLVTFSLVMVPMPEASAVSESGATASSVVRVVLDLLRETGEGGSLVCRLEELATPEDSPEVPAISEESTSIDSGEASLAFRVFSTLSRCLFSSFSRWFFRLICVVRFGGLGILSELSESVLRFGSLSLSGMGPGGEGSGSSSLSMAGNG